MRIVIATLATVTLVPFSSLPAAPTADASPDPLAAAARALEQGDVGACIDGLRRAFEAGYPTPGDVYADARFSGLREDAGARAAWRALMAEHPRESRLTMVPPGEAGRPMLIRGRVVRAPDGVPIPDAVLELYHTDHTGRYEPDESIGDDARSRLFCFVRTDAEGRFEVRTIQPAPYPGASAGAAHVHYRVRATGYRRNAQDFRPYDHPRDPDERRTAI